MRNLTIQRKKSFVGCAMKDQVYIRDEQTAEMIIEGVPCRKLGTLKNGETKTFQIEDGEQEIFLIVDKVSKDYCNARVTVPAGEDVYLSGKHHYVFGSNPFRFDGVEPAEQDKKKARKGKWITICSVIAGVIIGLFLPGGFLNPNVPDPQVFEKEDFQITLTEDFSEESLEDFLAVYISKSVYVFVMQEEKSYFDDITLEEYAQLVLEVNGRTDLLINKQEQYLWYEFTETPDAQELYYVSVCCEYEDAFYVVSFSTPVENRVDYKEQFLDWADTISFAADA